MRAYLILAPITLFLFGCGQVAKKSPAEVHAYVQAPENGLCQFAESGGARMEATYRPQELLFFQEFREAAQSNGNTDSLTKLHDELQYFLIRLSKENAAIIDSYIGDPDRYDRALTYLSSELGYDVRLVHHGDTLAAADVLYTGTQGRQSSNVMLAFRLREAELKDNITLIVNDDFFGLGNRRFEFKVDDINKIPALDYNL